ncbi:MAG: hypothetical protein J5532_01910 [Lachnospiraceae bacterium]|nr:hypothetical protein [Lachnospiraceae bacterium]
METDAEKSVFRHGGARRATAEELAFIKKKLIPDARASVAIGITLSVMLLCIIAWFVYGILRQKGIWLVVLSLAVQLLMLGGVVCILSLVAVELARIRCLRRGKFTVEDCVVKSVRSEVVGRHPHTKITVITSSGQRESLPGSAAGHHSAGMKALLVRYDGKRRIKNDLV